MGALAIAALIAPITPALAADSPADAPCATVDVIFARGSGQSTAAGEAERFRKQVDERIKSPLSYHYYELGSDKIDGHQYPAVKVDGSDWLNSVGAFVGSGGAFAYGDSVNTGGDELKAYMQKRVSKCGEDTKFILGGYSQGAQTIGEAYVERLPATLRVKVVFNVLVGDPKLFLPEGKAPIFKETPACSGSYTRSEWRRDMPAGTPQTPCNTYRGSLGARVPYLPSTFTSTTGLWCAAVDFICGSSSKLKDQSGHGTYGAEGGAIDEGVREALERLQAQLPAASRESVDVQVHHLKSGTTGLDVAFVIDSTASMGSQIYSAKDIAATLAGFVRVNRGRVALIEYRDVGDEFTARVLSPLNESTDNFNIELRNISVDGGGDSPEALMHALMVTLNGLDWRPGATKAAIVLTDETYHQPDLVDGSTLDTVAKRSLEIDPVNVYPVVPASLAEYYAPLAEETSGKVIPDDGDTAAALTEALNVIEERPVPNLEFSHYYGPVGATIRFDATSSYSVSSEIVRWDWDWNGDGVFEKEDATSIEEHVYDSAYNGPMQLRVTDKNGLIANYSVPVSIGAEEAPQQVPADTLTAAGPASDVTLTWEADVRPSKGWAVTVNGIPVGLASPDARTITVTDVERSETVEFGIAPVSAEDEVGPARVVYLDPPAAVTPTPTPTPTPTTPAPTPTPTTSTPAPTTSAPPTSEPQPSSTPVEAVAPSGQENDGPGGLAFTGGTLSTIVVGVGMALVVTGAILQTLRRRRG